MQNSIKRLFNLREIPQPHDAADALGMAYIAKILYKL
jgi:Holliday junction resolvasome RuvABC endonuclease subunit